MADGKDDGSEEGLITLETLGKDTVNLVTLIKFICIYMLNE